MSKELIISIIIIIVIVGLDILISNFVDGKMNYTLQMLEDMKGILEEEDYTKAREKFEEINEYWYESEKVFSFYIEHDELEKVASDLASLDVYIKLEDDEALEKVSTMAFIIKHIEAKDDLRLKNVF